MKMKSMISLLFIIIVSILYFFGFCEWDLPVYLLCVAMTLIFMFIFTRQEKKYKELHDKEMSLRQELNRNRMK